MSHSKQLVFILLLMATCDLLPCAPSAAADTADRSPSRPNILLLLADNWAWPHAGIYGDKSVKTPTFDRIASEGALFTHAFCQVPSCSSARAVLLTGQASHRLEDAANLWGLFPEHVKTYPQLLRKSGYSTGYMVKGWGPGIYHGEKHTKRNPAGDKFESFDAFLDSVPDGTPFCFWFGSHDPHQPWNRGEEFRSDLDPAKVEVPPYVPDHPIVRQAITDYYAEIQRFDHECDEMLQVLRRRGYLSNTLVVMVGDNGWQMPRGLANVYDAGTRVPMAVHWPGHITGSKKIESFISFEDFAPTFLTSAGVDTPEEMTGQDFSPLGTDDGSTQPQWRAMMFLERERHANVRAKHRSYPCRAVRTKEFLYVRNLFPELWPAGDPQEHWAVGPFGDLDNTPIKALILENRQNPEMKLFFELGFAKRPGEELYDLRTDPHQIRNVASDLKYASVKQTLSSRVDNWMKQTDDPRAENTEYRDFDNYPYFGQSAKSRRARASAANPGKVKLVAGQPTVVPGNKISVSFKAPASNYQVTIDAVYDVGTDLWAIATINRRDDVGATVITRVSDEISLTLPANRSLKNKVLGKDWNWGRNTDDLEYLKDRAALMADIQKRKGRLIWKRSVIGSEH